MTEQSIPASEHVAGWTPPRFFKLKRTMLAIAGALTSVNIWTGGPVFALLVGSQFEGWVGARAPSTGVSMKAILVVVVVLGVVELTLVLLMTRVSEAYDKLIGRPHKARRTSPWLRSLSGERDKSELGKYGVSVVERIAIISVVVCVLAVEAWFFFSPRSALPY
jgi:MFS family permease